MFMIYESLSKFIIQAKEGSLKTAEYPKDCLDLKMKVSFELTVAWELVVPSRNEHGMRAQCNEGTPNVLCSPTLVVIRDVANK